ncbi:MAG TPA: response regulator [Pyrinomonadaceae bacterium]|nr:response regulator [Pyrinomonadaceae bacterium]
MRNDRTILLVEDNEADIFIFKKVAKSANIENPIQVVQTGQKALDYLSGEGQYADRVHHPLPFLVVLDLKLPLKNGMEVLEWLRMQPDIQSTNVIILTSSSEPREIACARKLGALSYFVKPPSREILEGVINGLSTSTPASQWPLPFPGGLFDETPGRTNQ